MKLIVGVTEIAATMHGVATLMEHACVTFMRMNVDFFEHTLLLTTHFATRLTLLHPCAISYPRFLPLTPCS